MASQGWECPKCGKVYAPWVPSCRGCPGGVTTPAPVLPTISPYNPPYSPPIGDSTAGATKDFSVPWWHCMN